MGKLPVMGIIRRFYRSFARPNNKRKSIADIWNVKKWTNSFGSE